MSDPRIEVARAGPGRRQALSQMLGRAFVAEPMMRWPLGQHGDLEERFTTAFSCFLELALELGIVWEAGGAQGAAVWIAPGQERAWDVHPWSQPQIDALTDDQGGRYAAFWDWVHEHTPAEQLWQLDSIGVEPALQGRGLGSALIADGLARARATGTGAFLSTGTPRNVPTYERSGFRLVEAGAAPNGGPRIWFMRWDP